MTAQASIDLTNLDRIADRTETHGEPADGLTNWVTGYPARFRSRSSDRQAWR
jgi:hypothetical protein